MKPERPISNSQLTAFRKSPLHWKQYISEKKEQTDAMIFGSLCHRKALLPDLVEKEFFLMDLSQKPEPDKDFRNAKNRDWKEAQIAEAGERLVILPDDGIRAQRAVDALRNDSVASKYLMGEYEAKLDWAYQGLNLTGIRDINSPEYIVDLKFVNDADPRTFRKYIFNNEIYRQGGMYLDGEMNGEFTGDPHKRIIFIAVETSEPFGVSVHELDFEVINFGINEYRLLAQQLKDCIDNDYFPGYSFRNINGSFDITLPNYLSPD